MTRVQTTSPSGADWHGEADDASCRSFQPLLELLGRRWVGMVLLAGARGARRFGQYRAFVHGISDRVLTQRLRELEHYGLLERTVVPSTPVQVLYAPTDRGAELLTALQPLFDWSERNLNAFSAPISAPGTPLPATRPRAAR